MQMTAQNPEAPSRFGLRITVFMRCALIVAATTAIIAGLITVSGVRVSENVAREGVRSLGQEVTEFLAGQSSGYLRFGRHDELSALLGDAIERNAGRALGAIAVTQDGRVVAQVGRLEGRSTSDLAALAQTAAQTGALETMGDGFLIAAPAAFGAEDEISGAVAVAWTVDGVLTQATETKTQTIIFTLGLFATLLAAGALFIRWTVSRPLVLVERTMAEVAGGAFDGSRPASGQAWHRLC